MSASDLEDVVAYHDGPAHQLADGKAERVDQLSQRVQAELAIVVEFGGASLIADGGRAEMPGHDLAAEPATPLEKRDCSRDEANAVRGGTPSSGRLGRR